MKIVHLTHTDLRYDNRILKELEAISTVENYIILCLGVRLDENAAYSNRNIPVELVNLDLYMSKLKNLPRWFSYIFLLIEISWRLFFRAAKFKPEVIHCHDTMVLPAGFLLKFFYKSTLIYDAHELESNKNGQSNLLSYATLLIEKACWRKVDYLISVSDSIIGWYNTKFTPKPSVLVLNSPVLGLSGVKPKQSHNNNYFHKRYGIGDEELIFVYVGLFGTGRSIHTLLRIFADDCVKSHIVFVGYGELQRLIENESKKNPRIHYHEAVPHENVVDIIRSADVGLCLLEPVSLSDYYALPNKFFEYAFAGLIVLASDFPELETVVDKYKIGKCAKTDYYSLLEAVRAFDLEPLKKVSADVYDLSWEVQAGRLLGLYKSISLDLRNLNQ